MPLPSDPKLIALGEDLLKEFDTLFGYHPGFRPVHAKGILLTGTFTPSKEAATLTRAPHASSASTPVTARFSNSTGIPVIPDNDPNASPHGLAVRFNLAEHVHTDIVAHSTDGFPTHTPQEFLEFLRAIASSDPSKPKPSPIETFLGSHPAAFAFVQPRPNPASFATEAFFGVTSVRFTNQDGVSRYGRYRIMPDAGIQNLDEAAAKSKGPDYLFDDLKTRIAAGPVSFKIMVQIATENDVVNDATIHWPEDRPQMNFGTFSLTAAVPDDTAQQQQIIFDPIPRLDGIEPSDDPLHELRSAIYLQSGRRRRQAVAK
jgi:catalase